jgi:translation elongation factor EF-Tu-like GTPase
VQIQPIVVGTAGHIDHGKSTVGGCPCVIRLDAYAPAEIDGPKQWPVADAPVESMSTRTMTCADAEAPSARLWRP